MKTCSVDGCVMPHRARGLCSTHYNQSHRKPEQLSCAACGVLVFKTYPHRKRVTCSYECRAFLQHGPQSCPVPDTHPSRSTVVPADHPSRIPLVCDVPADHASRISRRVLTAGQCADCSAPYVVVNQWDTQSRYCSKRCMVRVARRTRRAREHGATGAWTWDAFARLSMRLGNVCSYCGADDNGGRPLDPDHVVPLSRGGHNGLTNLLPACHACNCDKRDLFLDEWRADRERRGLPPRRYDVSTFAHLTAHATLFDYAA